MACVRPAQRRLVVGPAARCVRPHTCYEAAAPERRSRVVEKSTLLCICQHSSCDDGHVDGTRHRAEGAARDQCDQYPVTYPEFGMSITCATHGEAHVHRGLFFTAVPSLLMAGGCAPCVVFTAAVTHICIPSTMFIYVSV